MKRRILIVDDEESIRRSLAGALTDEGYQVLTAADGVSALELLETERPHLLLLDIWMPQMDGMEVLRRIKAEPYDVSVIMISGHGNIETAVTATKLGAYDFIEKPLSLEKVILTIDHALKERKLEKQVSLYRQRFDTDITIVGKSAVMKQLKDEIQRAAPTDSYVLINGENGTGKELVARAVYSMSNRKDSPFVDVNCAAIPEELIESELFGYEKGAFTGATGKKVGKFDMADGGTILLDEIGDMSVMTQAKILRILQEQTFSRVGGTKTIKVDVRVLAATNQNLKKKIESGTFREDLFYRLNVIPLYVPPLRDRLEDIPLLAEHFIEEFAGEDKRRKKSINDAAMKMLTRYRWPGNVRELKNLIERLIIMSPEQVIGVGDLPVSIRSGDDHDITDDLLHHKSLKEAREHFEEVFITKKLSENDYNITQTAKALGLERSHLHKKIKAYNIELEK
ncbi:MAG: sigma-54-dependent Fis family transcriptional regulator [Deltaproteobacteria bacterium]|nr:sigma-54-dependent Fis family transcriptional regulator [Candidatus Zymogenaceae bacterium]